MKNIAKIKTISVLPLLFMLWILACIILQIGTEKLLNTGYAVPNACRLLDNSVTVELATENYQECRQQLEHQEIPAVLQNQDLKIQRLINSLNPQQNIGEVGLFTVSLTRKSFLSIFDEVKREIDRLNLKYYPHVYLLDVVLEIGKLVLPVCILVIALNKLYREESLF